MVKIHQKNRWHAAKIIPKIQNSHWEEKQKGSVKKCASNGRVSKDLKKKVKESVPKPQVRPRVIVLSLFVFDPFRL